MTVQEYRDYQAIHYSLLSSLYKSPKSVLSEEKNFTDAMKIGDAVDIILTQDENKINDKYIVAKVPKPTGQMGDFIDVLYSLHNKSNSNLISVDDLTGEKIVVIDVKLFDQAYNIIGFKRDKPDTVKERLIREGFDYLCFLNDSKGKKIIQQDEYSIILKCCETLKNHDFTKQYWQIQPDYIDIHYQYPVFFDVKYSLPGKCLIDILIINHKDKTVQPIDLKTTGDYWQSFPDNFIKWRYDIQASFYTYGVSEVFKDYKILPFKFIVISTQQPNTPIVYTTTQSDLELGEKGGRLINSRYLKGWRQLVDDYIWHRKYDLWEYPREVYESQGEISLNIFYDKKEVKRD